MKTVTVFGVTMSLTAFLVAMVGSILSLVIVVTLPKMWPVSIVFMLATFVAAYNVNCVVYGHCKLFAWIMVGLFTINAIIIYFSARQLAMTKMPQTAPSKRLR
jgi:NAD/NADP transhydrogenase beta subunit